MAAIQGIDISKHDAEESKKRFDEVARRAEAKLSGRSEESLEMDIFGLEIEVEE